jgi:hypothetical protein
VLVRVTGVLHSLLIILVLGSTLTGCASPQALDPYDPLKRINRAPFVSYRTFDRTALRPAARPIAGFCQPASADRFVISWIILLVLRSSPMTSCKVGFGRLEILFSGRP